MLQEFHTGVVIYYLAGTCSLVLLISAIIFYIFLHEKKVSLFRMQLQQEELHRQQAIYEALQQGEEKERNRIAEELHDGVSAKLAGLNMNLDFLRSRMDNDHDRPLVDRTFQGIKEVIDELREISHNLQPVAFTGKDLRTSLTGYIDQLNSRGTCSYQLFFEADFDGVSKIFSLNCHRIVTELLFNIHKHAEATEATVQITGEDSKLQIIVEDNGKGFVPGTAKGIGLTNIRNRAHLNKGSLNIDSSKNGTTVIVELPLP